MAEVAEEILIKNMDRWEIEINIPDLNLLINRDIETSLDHLVIIIRTLVKDLIEAKGNSEVSEEATEEMMIEPASNAGFVDLSIISPENALTEMREEVGECVMNLEAWTEIDHKLKGWNTMTMKQQAV